MGAHEKLNHCLAGDVRWLAQDWERGARELSASEPNQVIAGTARWEEQQPEAAEVFWKLAESHAQQDSSFLTEMAFTRLTAEQALKQLSQQGFTDEQLPAAGTMANILNRLGFRLRPVVKSKPLKKIPETDAIFNNIKKRSKKTGERHEMLEY